MDAVLRHPLLDRLGIAHPILQAPMAGIATPALAAAVSEAGGLGALGIGPLRAEAARALLAEVSARTRHPFGVNLFCASPPVRDPRKEAAWLERLRPHFEACGVSVPRRMEPLFAASLTDEAMLPLLLEASPRVVSFHLGMPDRTALAVLKRAGIILVATATSLDEARQIEAAGFDAVVAQGIEAGGHRGVFDPDREDAELGTLELVRILVSRLSIPVIAAGGIMDGADIRTMLQAGAASAQLGTAFLCCPETSGHIEYLAAILRQGSDTVTTRAISGRPARAIRNLLTAVGDGVPSKDIPAFPLPLSASSALISAAAAAHQRGYDALWAGTGLSSARALPAANLMQRLVAELARGGRSRASEGPQPFGRRWFSRE